MFSPDGTLIITVSAAPRLRGQPDKRTSAAGMPTIPRSTQASVPVDWDCGGEEAFRQTRRRRCTQQPSCREPECPFKTIKKKKKRTFPSYFYVNDSDPRWRTTPSSRPLLLDFTGGLRRGFNTVLRTCARCTKNTQNNRLTHTVFTSPGPNEPVKWLSKSGFIYCGFGVLVS